ncbi:MAG: 1-deoxy-D-xylulose-5-phosphate reductoisomerase [Clostridium sp. SCN 57-10]|nr:MAG: 1-deoxy-D-xylulose-5-phosphate reductoisomerase [Clostridium sp. SCN 57-10]
MSKTVSIVGSTGSIGTQTLDVIERNGMRVAALAASTNDELVEHQARRFRPSFVALHDEKAARALKERLADTDIRVLGGIDGVCEVAAADEADITVNAAVGIAGLRPSLAALQAGKTLALANKESLVCAGQQVMDLANQNGLAIVPVDSEHSAVFQALLAGRKCEVSRIIITASGGPFFGMTLEQQKGMTPRDALRHPSWSMGAKITIDSATMMNKGFEMIEAMWLFGVPPDCIEAVVHRGSIVHSLVEFCDGAVIAQMSPPDMHLPIQYALGYPERLPQHGKLLDFTSPLQLTFMPIDRVHFPSLDLCEQVMRRGGNAGAVVNGANEAAVALFLQEKIGFTQIYDLVREAYERVPHVAQPSLQDIFDSDEAARRIVCERAF